MLYTAVEITVVTVECCIFRLVNEFVCFVSIILFLREDAISLMLFFCFVRSFCFAKCDFHVFKMLPGTEYIYGYTSP